nr:hypothetical protein Iba_chr13eCG10470 [Ipomoea batatas]
MIDGFGFAGSSGEGGGLAGWSSSGEGGGLAGWMGKVSCRWVGLANWVSGGGSRWIVFRVGFQADWMGWLWAYSQLVEYLEAYLTDNGVTQRTMSAVRLTTSATGEGASLGRIATEKTTSATVRTPSATTSDIKSRVWFGARGRLTKLNSLFHLQSVTVVPSAATGRVAGGTEMEPSTYPIRR